jgi:16S rRNA C967 or C1407 C5-methylase (RsmB/RsmF family)
MAKTKKQPDNLRYIRRGTGATSSVRIPVFEEVDDKLIPVYELKPNGEPRMDVKGGQAYKVQAYTLIRFKPFHKEMVEGTPVAWCCYDVDENTPKGVREGLANKYKKGEIETIEEWESRRNPDRKEIIKLQKDNESIKDDLEEKRKENLTLQEKIAALEEKAKIPK